MSLSSMGGMPSNKQNDSFSNFGKIVYVSPPFLPKLPFTFSERIAYVVITACLAIGTLPGV
jgi:hypothetical protein